MNQIKCKDCGFSTPGLLKNTFICQIHHGELFPGDHWCGQGQPKLSVADFDDDFPPVDDGGRT